MTGIFASFFFFKESCGSPARTLGDTVPEPGTASRGSKRTWDEKASLKDVSRDEAQKRTKEAAEFIDDFCERENEDSIDVLFFLLCERLRESGDPRYEEVMLCFV